jgi:diadenylate cyclase
MPDISHAQEILSDFTFSSAVDVLLIALVIYWTIRILSGTQAMTLLRGAAALFLVFVVLGRLFDLQVINFLVDHSFTALIIGAAVVFQPEIRRALDRLGRTSTQGWLNRPKYDEVIDSVVRAAARMSIDRHGGLFVIERETGLQEVIETGVPVDAKASPELLAGIFFPNSPLHDMAVVLHEERVVAAGCILPLATTLSEGERNLGTRHRAAIGITEQTDALSVVVSEETGDISVALHGRLTHVADERRLRAVLEALLEREPAIAPERDGRTGVHV